MVAFAQQHRKERVNARTTRRCLPNAAILGREVAVNMVGSNRIDAAIRDAFPKRLAVGAFTQRRIDLPNIASRPFDRMCQIVGTSLDSDVSTGIARALGLIEGQPRGSVHNIQTSSGLTREHGGP